MGAQPDDRLVKAMSHRTALVEEILWMRKQLQALELGSSRNFYETDSARPAHPPLQR